MQLDIAGTSSGGSSYTRRILQALERMTPHEALHITITSGVAQKTVYHIVINDLLELYSFMGKRGGIITNRIFVDLEK